jgi:hypothetical protein
MTKRPGVAILCMQMSKVPIISGCGLISLRLRFRRNFLSVLHLNLVSSPIKGILEILNLTPRCIPMDMLKLDFGLFCRIYAVKGKEISIFLQIWTGKYVYLWTLTCTNSWTTPRDQNRHKFCYSMFLNERSMSIMHCVYASISFMGCWQFSKMAVSLK